MDDRSREKEIVHLNQPIVKLYMVDPIFLPGGKPIFYKNELLQRRGPHWQTGQAVWKRNAQSPELVGDMLSFSPSHAFDKFSQLLNFGWKVHKDWTPWHPQNHWQQCPTWPHHWCWLIDRSAAQWLLPAGLAQHEHHYRLQSSLFKFRLALNREHISVLWTYDSTFILGLARK